MLTELDIENVVLIDRLNIAFRKGLCVLTGETGAGKSVLLDSLGLALGMRAESGLVREGTYRARVTASFQIPSTHEAHMLLHQADIPIEDDTLLLRRIVYNTGKSKAFINDQPVSIGLLKQIGDTLVEIHGQFETQGLLNPATHRAMLDTYAALEEDLTDLSHLWEDWKEAQIKHDDIRSISARAREEETYLRLCVEDLQKMNPSPGEEQELSALRERLKNREKVLEGLSMASMHLGNDQDPVQKAWAALDTIADGGDDLTRQALQSLARASGEIAEAQSLILSAQSELMETDYNLEDIDERLYALRMQARKHKCAPDDLPAILDDLQAQLQTIENSDEALESYAKECTQARHAYIQKAEEISRNRKKIAEKLNALVMRELAPLKLEKARFVTQIEPLDEIEWSARGIDRVRFLVATNPGSVPAPIHKIASGGEMSRFMLALKVIIAQEGSTHSFIFDEVDAGIGGATADAVGERLARLAQAKQVLVVTHAPQVAARADHHWIVTKNEQKSGQVITHITPLGSRTQRCEEIARMLAGADITQEARAAAAKLIDQAA
ncbi:MAG: DNA repair protein RecN [Alphaproteobacteria bacterium]